MRLTGPGISSLPDWAGAGGKWYTVAQPFLSWAQNVFALSMGTFTVSLCSLDDIDKDLQAYLGRRPNEDETELLDPLVPYSTARPQLFFSGLNQALMPNMPPGSPKGPVFVRGVVRLSTDDPPVACWSWIVDKGPLGERVTARVVQMPGRGGNAFFGVSASERRADSSGGTRHRTLSQIMMTVWREHFG